MSRKRLLIIVATALCAMFAIVIGGAIIVGIWLMRSSKSTAISVPTAVGTPMGPATTKAIGPPGGSMASADGRITVDVPPNAVSDSVDFSIQPITNKSQHGLGDAYRMEPSGRTFSVPIKLSFKFTDQDINDTVPDMLAVAYQDNSGVWQFLKPDKISEDSRIFTVSTTHFTDFSLLKRIHLEPATQHVRVGKSTYVEIVGCNPYEPVLLERITIALGGTVDTNRGNCHVGDFLNGFFIPTNWYTDIGTIEHGRIKVKYTAPATKPSPNVATVSVPYDTAGRGMLVAHVIIDAGFKASGGDGPISYSGTVCSLEEPFKVIGTHPLITYPIEFVPNGPTTGTFSYHVASGYLVMSGSGTYVVEGADTDHPEIVCKEASEAHGPYVGSSGSGMAHIKLLPLETNECDGQ